MPLPFEHLSGSPRPGADAPNVRRAEDRGGARRVKTGGGAVQRVRQKATRERRRSGDGPTRNLERTCVGCGVSGDASDLLRLLHVPTPEGQPAAPATVIVDWGGKGTNGKRGRGAWIHPRQSCIERACPRGLSKAFACHIQVTAADLVAQIVLTAERRLVGLLLASLRSRRLVYGRDAVKEVLGETPLVIMATDAQAVAKDGELQRAGLDGKVVCWSTKAQLGHWLGRSEVGVVAITDAPIAEVMRRAIALTTLTAGVGTTSPKSGEALTPGQTEDVSAEDTALVELNGTAGLMSRAELSSAGTSDGAGRDEELSEVR